MEYISEPNINKYSFNYHWNTIMCDSFTEKERGNCRRLTVKYNNYFSIKTITFIPSIILCPAETPILM